MKYPLGLLSFHDIHLGHDRTPTNYIIDNLYRDLNEETLSQVNLIFFAGDLFDQALLYSESCAIQTTLFFLHVLEICRQRKIVIRMVNGTSSHDANQPDLLAMLHQEKYPDVDFRFVKDMEIEHHKGLDITILYVPDEYASREQMYLIAKSLLKEHQLDKVDFILGHNQFAYQFNEQIRHNISSLNEEDWNDMININGFFGHVHKRSEYKKIQVAGSYDRLAHGEEEPKGFLKAIYQPDEHTVQFIENKHAKLYKTLVVPTSFDLQDESSLRSLITQIDEIYQQQPQAHIRLKYQDETLPIRQILKQLQVRYPEITFSQLYKGQTTQEDKKAIPLPEDEQYHFINITRDNIVRLLEEEMQSQGDDDRAPIDLLTQYIGKIT